MCIWDSGVIISGGPRRFSTESVLVDGQATIFVQFNGLFCIEMAFMSRRLNMAHGVFMFFASILSAIWGLSNAVILGAQLPLVRIEDGQVQGAVETTLLDQRPYYSFKGIPYGKSPVGSLRFKAPVKADAWTGVRNATEFGSPCAQPTMHLNNYYGEEDCLTLNVFTPGKLFMEFPSLNKCKTSGNFD